MNEPPQDHLEILTRLARDYQQKHKELEDALQTMQPDAVVRQLRFYAELTTDRFRSAQVALFKLIAQDPAEELEQTLGAAATLCRCFDEMRILFEMLLEHASKVER